MDCKAFSVKEALQGLLSVMEMRLFIVISCPQCALVLHRPYDGVDGINYTYDIVNFCKVNAKHYITRFSHIQFSNILLIDLPIASVLWYLNVFKKTFWTHNIDLMDIGAAIEITNQSCQRSYWLIPKIP
jgi:hypothetical protein